MDVGKLGAIEAKNVAIAVCDLQEKGDDPFKLFSPANCGDLSILGLEPRFLRFWPSLTMTKFLG